ncbi:MAG: hypothetical protein KDH09_15335 [Chrysiogenetes bacterium]|nr:hypothetical protein [Chrysiogenetes bacterium]
MSRDLTRRQALATTAAAMAVAAIPATIVMAEPGAEAERAFLLARIRALTSAELALIGRAVERLHDGVPGDDVVAAFERELAELRRAEAAALDMEGPDHG